MLYPPARRYKLKEAIGLTSAGARIGDGFIPLWVPDNVRKAQMATGNGVRREVLVQHGFLLVPYIYVMRQGDCTCSLR